MIYEDEEKDRYDIGDFMDALVDLTTEEDVKDGE